MGYSVDLRERIVEAVLERRFSIREAASTFRVGHATVERYLRRFREHGELTPCKPSGRPSRVNGEQLEALRKQLEVIGKALKQHLLGFSTPVELGDQVKAGRVDDVVTKLAELKAI